MQIIHYLETLRPHQLLEQVISTAFRAAADTLSQSTFGDLKFMKAKVNQLYLTLASSLRRLQGTSSLFSWRHAKTSTVMQGLYFEHFLTGYANVHLFSLFFKVKG